MLNVGPRYLIGKPLSVFVGPDDRTAFLAQLRDLRADQPPRSQVVGVRPRGDAGEERVAELTVAPDRDLSTGGTLLRWQLRDVTVEHRSADELRQLNAELEARVQSRTAALEELLRGKATAEKRLAEADRRKDEFLATLAHDLRNPLGTILSALGVVRTAGPAVVSPVAVIERQARRIDALVKDLLDVSRIAEGKLRVQIETVDLGEAARMAAEATTALAGGLDVRVELNAQPAWVRADPGRLEQVLVNLISNALKYSDPRGTVSVETATENGHALARVRDTGVGIPADVLPHIFDMFLQADPGRDRAQGGLGIGLHLVKRLVEFHGGSVEAHSAGPGQGSVFVIRLPLADAPRQSAA